jgi:UDP-N-acetylglucosamine diphosphorylase/glucosamine-1-phosphate N-acetyltransferase
MQNNIVIIMAGGLGKRMESMLPKVLHTIGDEPMLVRIVKHAFEIKPKKIFIVVGKYLPIIRETLEKFVSLTNIEFVNQQEALGTGHAIQCCRKQLKSYLDTNVLILSGDVPLLTANTMREIVENIKGAKITTTMMDNPYGYGRIVETNGSFQRIVEEKDCSEEECNIKKVNCGIYGINAQMLFRYLPLLKNENSQKEYYLTDIISLIQKHEEIDIEMVLIPSERQYEIMGVNTKHQLEELNDLYQMLGTYKYINKLSTNNV